MTTSNKTLSRADLALADLSANGGVLSPMQANQFIDFIVEEPTVLQQSRIIRMTAPEMKINRMGFGGRIMHAARSAGSANDEGGNDRYARASERSSPTTAQISLTTKEVIAEVRIPYEALEDNIEGQSLQTHIIRQIAQRAALDLEEKALWGDTSLSATDAYLGQQDGWMKLASLHLLDWQSQGINAMLFTDALLTFPQRYLRLLDQMKAFVSPADRLRYMSWLQARGTALGDAAIQGNFPLSVSGLSVEAAASMSLGPSGTLGHSLITPPKNLIWGITRDVTIETDRDIRSREHIIVVTARTGMQIDDKEAVVRVDNIGNFAEASLPVHVTNSSSQPVQMHTVA